MNVGYMRVSTNEQATEGYSLEYQENVIKNKFYEQMEDDYIIIKDEGRSATKTNRPGYQKLVKLIKEDKIDTIIVSKIDRLSRCVIDFNNFINLCIEHGVTLISIKESIDMSSAMGRFILNLLISLAEMESAQISERTKTGYIGKLEEGKYPFSKAPYGFKKTKDHKLIPKDDEVEILKEIIIKKYAEGYNLEYIRTKLREKGVYMSIKRIDKIVKNTIYFGYIEYEGTRYDIVEPLVDEKLIKSGEMCKCQTKYFKRKRTKHIYRFKGLVYIDGKPAKHTTITHRKKPQKYYFRDSIYINENQIIEEIEYEMNELKNSKKIYRKNIEKMLKLNQVTQEEYQKAIKEYDEKQDRFLRRVKKIEVEKNKEIKVCI